ncbi:LytTr DNA-binding domain-containing protein [Ekhidna lutea]|uniref:LytTr DNA-binding domain-containing protein n=1 Tax=Ekhidna lutea TaxID=447679 RepID=A0A239HTD5_EKHLU|nr:7TM-DISM domain-containing protein [Ekhidna lutea]SNS84589.1 LytTr DNA-binding domain-containing protein [Ekhidna lutea]
MYLIKYFQLAALFIFVNHAQVFAQQKLILEGDEGVFNINPHTQVFSTQDSLEGSKAWQLIKEGKLTPLSEKVNPGISNAAYWIYIPLKNNLPQSEAFYLEVDYAQLDYMQLYEIVDDSAVRLYETGDRFVFSQRPVQYRNFTFPISIKEGEEKEYLLNIDKRKSAVRFPLTLYTTNSFWTMYNKETIFYGFCFGTLALVILISLLVGIRLSMPIFLWYALYVLTFGLRCFAKLGYGYQYITSGLPEFNTHFFPFTTQLSMVFLIMYIQQYFNTVKNLPVFHRVMDGILLLFIVSSIVWVLFPGFIISFGPVLISMRYVVVCTIIVFAYYSAFQHLKINSFRAKMFLLGYSMFFLGVFSQILMEYGAIDRSLVPGDPLFAGFFMEIGVLSYAMVVLIVNIVREKNTLSSDNEKLQNNLENLKEKSKATENSYVVLKTKALLDPKRIKYIQADDHYLEFYLIDKERPEIDRNKLSELLQSLPMQFVQTHRSTIVNLEYVKTIYSNHLLLYDDTELRLSRTFKKKVEERLIK